jgi:transcriptional regulator with XRE-family HTH domain
MSESNENKAYLEAFGKELKNIRINYAKKSLRIFAYEAGIPCATLSRLENGKRIPNIITLKKISLALNWQLCDLIKIIEQNLPEKIKNCEF